MSKYKWTIQNLETGLSYEVRTETTDEPTHHAWGHQGLEKREEDCSQWELDNQTSSRVEEFTKPIYSQKLDVDGNPIKLHSAGDPILDSDGDDTGQVYSEDVFEMEQTGSEVIDTITYITIPQNYTISMEDIRDDENRQKLRAQREPLLKEVDVMINELTLGVRTDTQAVKDYRQALLDVTSQADLENPTWPTKP